MNKEELLLRLRDGLPVIWERVKTDKLTGGAVRSATLANLMCNGDIPEGSFRVGRKVCFERDGFLKWLGEKIEILDPDSNEKNPFL